MPRIAGNAPVQGDRPSLSERRTGLLQRKPDVLEGMKVSRRERDAHQRRVERKAAARAAASTAEPDARK
ncbi:hypothetical protein AB0C21_42405 [Spirillospora sp. NPDC049024]